MKKWVLAIGLILLTTPIFAEETSTANNMDTPTLSKQTSADVKDHTHTYVDTHGTYESRSNFEAGNYLDFIYQINSNFDVGVKNSYLWENKEFTTLVGVTVKFGGKKDQTFK